MRTSNTLSLCVLAILISALASSCAPSEQPEAAEEPVLNMLTAQEEADGWRLLFDGQSLAGWRGLGLADVPTSLWQVENGVIHKVHTSPDSMQADGQPLTGNDLLTIETFPAFEFAFEFKVDSASNSGVKYNVSEEMSTAFPPPNAALGFEYQVLDPAHPDAQARFPLRVSGALYDLMGSDVAALAPTGEWNQGRILFDGSHGEHWLNGVKIVEYDLGTPEFESALAASKYAVNPGFADPRDGHIVLQDHFDEVWFRNLKIKTGP